MVAARVKKETPKLAVYYGLRRFPHRMQKVPFKLFSAPQLGQNFTWSDGAPVEGGGVTFRTPSAEGACSVGDLSEKSPTAIKIQATNIKTKPTSTIVRTLPINKIKAPVRSIGTRDFSAKE